MRSSAHTHTLIVALACVVTVVSGCGSARSPEGPRAASSPPAGASREIAPSRSPEGVVLEIAAPMPPPSSTSGARGVIVLAEPPPDEAVRDVLFAYFDALRRRDTDAIRTLFSDGAVRIDVQRGHQGDREAMLTLVLQSMRARDFGKVSPSEIVVPEQIERYGALDFATANQKKPEDMAPLDVFVRVTMPTQRGAAEKLFEDAVVFILRPEAGKLRIVTMNEEAAPPLAR